MSEVLTKQVCDVRAAYDMVGLQMGPHRILMWYQTAFKIAAGVAQSAKLAARFEGVSPQTMAAQIKATQQDPLEPMSREYRRSGHVPNFEEWKVSFESNLVVLTFDETSIKIHFGEALELYTMIRTEAKNAKRWAGDSSRSWNTRAHLVDAEENDKFVYVE